MKIDLLDISSFIELNRLAEISSPIIYQRGGIPTSDGLLSNEVFGMNVKSRKHKFAYINLKTHMLQPHVYRALSRVYPSLDRIIAGQKYITIEDGKIIDDDNGETGLEYLYEHWNDISWERSVGESAIRKERLDMIISTPRQILFTDNFLVIPVFYRDNNSSGGGAETDPLNTIYSKMIRLATSIQARDMFDFSYHGSIFALQRMLLELYDTFKRKLEKKNGIIRKYLMGKNVSYCTRSVISNPLYHSNSPDTIEIPFDTVGIPLGQACVLAYPYIMRWLKLFFEREFIEPKEMKTLRLADGGKEMIINFPIYKPEIYFDEKYIRNLVDSYISDPEGRFDPIQFPVLPEGSTKPIFMDAAFTGMRLNPTSDDELSDIAHRPLTKTDILFMAACDALKDKHVVVTRYPVDNVHNMFIAKCRPISTTQTDRVMINGEIYEYYPHVDRSVPRNRMHIKFVDSTQFSNSHLAGMGGDYDGDQITLKLVWSQDANAECAGYLSSKSFYLNSQGKNVCIMQFEVPQTIYDMTKDPDASAKVMIPEIALPLIDKPSNEYTFDFICALIAYRSISGKPVRQFAPNTPIEIPKGKLGNKETIISTLGRLIFYKVVIIHSGLDKFVSFAKVNKTLTAKEYNKIEDDITQLLVSDQVTTDTFKKFIDNRDWFGLQIHGLVTVSFTEKTVKTPQAVKELRDKLFKQYEKELDAGDIIVANKIENELIAKMVDEIKDDPGFDIYASGARGSVNNHMKNMFIMRGGVFNPVTGKQDIMKTCFSEGIMKEDFTAASNSVVGGAYPKSCSTADSGYLAKQLMAAMQSELIGEDESDCGTDMTLDTVISNTSNFLNRHILENGKVVRLTQDIISKYAGKTVKMYSPMFCRGVKGCICEKCGGVQDSKFVGLQASDMATKLTRLNMKKFHVTNIEFHTLTPKDILITNDGSKYFTHKDGNIVANTNIDIVVPDYHYGNNLVEELGPTMRLFGTVPVIIGGNITDTLNIPSWHNYYVYTSDTQTIDLPGEGLTKCKVFHYEKDHDVCADMVVEDASNAQLFLKQIIYGKIPGTIPYDKALSLWERNQVLNSVNFGVASIIQEVVLAASYRYKKDPTKKFGMVYANNPGKVSLYDYEMASFRRICQLSSTFAGITFECFDDMVTSGVNRSHTNANETYSPLEELLKL